MSYRFDVVFFFQLTKDDKYSELFLIEYLKRDWLSTVHLCRIAKAVHRTNFICENFIKIQGRKWLPKAGWAISNAERPCCLAAPSILPKPGWAIAHPAHTTYAPEIYHCQQACTMYFVNVPYVQILLKQYFKYIKVITDSKITESISKKDLNLVKRLLKSETEKWIYISKSSL